MSRHDDLDLWQVDADDGARRQSVLEQVPVKRALLEQRRLDLQAITNLLTRAANDLRASERRALDAEARATAAEACAAEAEEREKKVNAQAVRAFETMKERIAQSDAKAQEAHARARELEDRLNDAILQLDKRTLDIEKAAEERSFEIGTRLEAAEMRIAAARRALGDDLVTSVRISAKEEAASGPPEAAPASSFAPTATDILDIKMRH